MNADVRILNVRVFNVRVSILGLGSEVLWF